MSEGFVKMANGLLSRTDLKAGAKIVAAIIDDRQRQGKPVSLRILKRLSGMSMNAVIRGRRELQRAGLLPASETEALPASDSEAPNVLSASETEAPPASETEAKALPKRKHIPEEKNYTDNNSAAGAAAPSSQQGSLLPDDQPKPKRSAKAKLDTDPRVSEFITWFAGEYEAKTNQKYIVQGGKDGGLVKTLLKAVTIGELKAATANMLTDGWGQQRASIGLLSSQINVWKRGASNGKSGSTNRRGMSASDWHREQASREYPEQLHAPTIKIPRTG